MNPSEFFLRYGGKRAFLSHLQYRALHGLGRLDRYRHVDWPGVKRIVFVCTGNICRSPYAEVRARDAGVAAASFGLRARSGDKANSAAIRNAARRGVALDTHRARIAHDVDIAAGDLLIGFEPQHAALLEALFGGRNGVAVTLLGLWAHPAFPYIHDPYGLSDAYFEQCYARIDRPLAALVQHLRACATPSP